MKTEGIRAEIKALDIPPPDAAGGGNNSPDELARNRPADREKGIEAIEPAVLRKDAFRRRSNVRGG